MWNNLPYDLLSQIFSYLPFNSLVCAKSTCRQWNVCPVKSIAQNRHLPWFLALPTRRQGMPCYAYNPEKMNWHSFSMEFVPDQVKPIASIGGLILLKLTSFTYMQLALCNIFTKQFNKLPLLNTTRTNPAVGIVEFGLNCFRVYVAGGMSEKPGGGALYEPRLEMYDSRDATWRIFGTIPIEFAVRLTVWTPNESVYCNGVLYWITSARAYSVIGFEVGGYTWKELSVPMADRLEFASLVRTNEKVTLVGGIYGGDVGFWELGEDDCWNLVDKVPFELAVRYLEGKCSWVNTKCVCIDKELWLYRDLSSGMIVRRGNLEWIWVESCKIKGGKVRNFPIKGVLLHPNVASSCTSEL